MTCIIYLETERTPGAPADHWDFIWSVSGADWNTDEIHMSVVSDDRLYAAIVNVGKACRCLADNEVFAGTIQIKSDIDGLDKRHDSEHDALFAMLAGGDDPQARKLRSIYHRYNKFLGRIKQLQMQWNIHIELAN